MKKIISIFLTLSLVISISACAGSKVSETTNSPSTTVTTQTTTEATTATTEATTVVTTYPGMQKPATKGGAAFLITNAKNKSTSQKSYCAEIFEEINITNNKVDTTYGFTSEAYFNVASKNEYSVTLKDTMSIDGENITYNSKFYTKDGFCYISEFGTDLKYEITDENKEEFDLISDISKRIKSIPERAISEITEDEKNIYITVELAKDDALSLFDDILSDMEEGIAGLTEGLSIETQRAITSANVNITVDRDGYMKSYTPSITFSYITPADGVSNVTKIAYVYSISFFRDNEVKLDIPEGYENFPLYSEEGIPFETLSAAVGKTLALEDYAATQYSTIEMEFSGIATEILYQNQLSVNDENSNNIVFRETMEMEAFNQYYYSDLYYENGYYYMTSGETTGKVPAYQIDHDPNKLVKDFLTESLVIVSQDGVTQSSAELTTEGMTKLYFLLDETYFRLNFSAQIDDNISLLGLETEDMVISVPELYVYVTEDGYIDYYEVSYYLDCTIEAEGQTVPLAITIYDSFEFDAIGEEATVTPPTGYKSFPSTNVNT